MPAGPARFADATAKWSAGVPVPSTNLHATKWSAGVPPAMERRHLAGGPRMVCRRDRQMERRRLVGSIGAVVVDDDKLRRVRVAGRDARAPFHRVKVREEVVTRLLKSKPLRHRAETGA